MGRQVRFSVSDREFERLQNAGRRWGRSENDLALDAFRQGLPAIMQAMRQSVSMDEYLGLRAEGLEYQSLSEAITANWDHLLENCSRIEPKRLVSIRDGKAKPTDLELARLAIALSVTEEYLESLPLVDEGTGHAGKVMC